MAEDQRESAAKAAPPVDLQQLADSYGERLVRCAYLLCGDEAEAQDLAQETLLQAHKSAHRFQGNSSVSTWLYGILRNLCHRHLRKQKRLVFEEALVLEQPAEPVPARGADEEFCANRLARALQALSVEHREAIILRYYESLKIEEIAAYTGASKGTVKSRLHYALRHLHQLLPEEMNLFAPEGTHYQAAP